MDMDKLCKINVIEKEVLNLEGQKKTILEMFDLDKIKDKSSATYRMMKEIRDKKYVELDDRIDELMMEHNKLLQ